MKHAFALAAVLVPICTFAAPAKHADGWIELLDESFSQWDVYLSYPGDVISSVVDGTAPKDLKPIGLNKDEKGVFSIIEENGEPILRITGEIYGAAATKQAFDNFHFKAKFKWGEKKWEPRLTEPKDTGVLYFSVGEFGVDYWHSWMEAQEMQIMEGGIGDYWTIASAQIDIRAHKPAGSDLYHYSADAPRLHFAAESEGGDAVANHCRRGEDREILNAWNEIELICYAGNCVHIANGAVVMALSNSQHMVDGKPMPLARGKLQIQSEAAEVFYKDVTIKPIESMPAEYRGYFK